jgi:hypothetical protein
MINRVDVLVVGYLITLFVVWYLLGWVYGLLLFGLTLLSIGFARGT